MPFSKFQLYKSKNISKTVQWDKKTMEREYDWNRFSCYGYNTSTCTTSSTYKTHYMSPSYSKVEWVQQYIISEIPHESNLNNLYCISDYNYE